MADLQARWHPAMADLPADQFEKLLRDSTPPEHAPLPFFSWAWLHALEASGSIVARHGWQACHLGLWRGTSLVALAPLYVKGHSFGEFVFDQSFAQLASNLGLRYYPKLVGMSPVSPVEGYRFFIAAGEDVKALTIVLFQQIELFCQQQQLLSCNLLYVDPAFARQAEACGWSLWLNEQSEWSNPGFECFEDYLASFNANQRRNIRRERQAIIDAGIAVTPLAGEDISAQLLERMHLFYAQHCARWGAWGSKYLNAAFFDAAFELRSHLVLFSAHRGDPLSPVAMSFCVQNGVHLWGRYWGCEEEINHLHFEVCYYAPLQWAIEQRLRSFDPGAGGRHKKRRGFEAHPRSSVHRWFQPRFSSILRDWLPGANQQTLADIAAINADLPFSATYDPPQAPSR
ncbi:MAG: GNAT family N-acetyltransferase [Cyanobacteriota bacterium]|nr:GNAT family N-acetyltransferase [Cyanobacteriota bacterium]